MLLLVCSVVVRASLIVGVLVFRAQVLDNAPIHLAADIFGLLMLVLRGMNVTLVLLPKYSPELNPCELVFAQAKHYLRHHRQDSAPFAGEIVKAFASVSDVDVMSYYEHCLYRFDEV